MSYNIKLSDYSLLPKRAIPLDARSHFESFASAYNTITEDVVTTVEASNNINNDYKKFYAGQIITTTSSGTWQVVLKSTIDIYLKYDSDNRYKVRWNGSSTTDERKDLYALKISDKQLNLYDSTGTLILSVSSSAWKYWSTTDITFKIYSCLVPFSGGSGSGGTLTLTATDPLTYNQNTSTLSLNLGDGLKVDENKQLTLSAELSNYNTLKNKPQINSIELGDNKSFEDLGLKGLEETDILSAIEEAEKV